MVHSYAGSNFVAESLDIQKPKLLFIGTDIDFSEQSLRAVTDEFPSFDAVRLTSLADLTLYAQFNNQVALVVLAQSNAPHLLKTFDACQSACQSAQIALAYSDSNLARAVLAELAPKYGLQNLSFLPMDKQIDCWLAIVGLVMRHDTYVPTELLEGLSLLKDSAELEPAKPTSAKPCQISVDADEHKSEIGPLTARETEVLALVAKGQQNKTIANLLDVSEHTVKLHIHNVIRKLGVSNRTAAAAWYHTASDAAPTNGIGLPSHD